ncbi:hypothetical protein ISN45_At04g024280 [Arabidopsis thaliana x Arabidopsis arenosa]|uniref:Transmembrane protein n=1 Tax=Arabidopsis thaliana x Arabidopsis arenosa TaxID=1240361 RepID=A0A8T2E4X0_9BRAS|nr:hypothetical protein ISN45_At04g024280 [Arabidopsis thaliana x Arabidopsis arenosa]
MYRKKLWRWVPFKALVVWRLEVMAAIFESRTCPPTLPSYNLFIHVFDKIYLILI